MSEFEEGEEDIYVFYHSSVAHSANTAWYQIVIVQAF